MRVFSSGKEFLRGLARHWVWTLVLLLVAAPFLVAVLSPVRSKLQTLPVIGGLFKVGG